LATTPQPVDVLSRKRGATKDRYRIRRSLIDTIAPSGESTPVKGWRGCAIAVAAASTAACTHSTLSPIPLAPGAQSLLAFFEEEGQDLLAFAGSADSAGNVTGIPSALHYDADRGVSVHVLEYHCAPSDFDVRPGALGLEESCRGVPDPDAVAATVLGGPHPMRWTTGSSLSAAIGAFHLPCPACVQGRHDDGMGCCTSLAITVGALAKPRRGHTASLLQDGTVAVVGGQGTRGEVFESVEIYDPMARSWSSGPALAEARTFHGAGVLDDGSLLVAGGFNKAGSDAGGFASGERLSPGTGQWIATASLSGGRAGAADAVIAHRSALLLAGGISAASAPEPATSSEVFDSATSRWRRSALVEPVWQTQAVWIESAALALLCGGWSGVNGADILPSCTLFDTKMNAWRTTGPMAKQRYAHTMSVLEDGTVLVTGGDSAPFGQPPVILSSAEIYDPRTERWTPAPAQLLHKRAGHTATVLKDGRVLVVGGLDQQGNPIGSAEIFDPVLGTWTELGSLSVPRFAHTATLLGDGTSVLVAGGCSSGSACDQLAAPAELFESTP
jgi:hypothetical protein